MAENGNARRRWLTFAFDEPELERAFLDEITVRARARLRIVALASVLVFLGFSLWDRVMLPFTARSAWMDMYPMIFAPVVALWAFTFTSKKIFARFWTLAVLINAWVFTGAELWLQWKMPVEASPRIYNGFIVLATTMPALWGLRLVYLPLGVVPMLVGYPLVTMVLAPIPLVEAGEHLLWISASVLVAVLVAHQIESEKRRAFAQQRATERERVRADVAERARHLAEALLLVSGSPAHELAVGAIVDDKYRVVRELGRGGMGAVYEVERVADGKSLAIKVLRGSAEREALARFAREAQIAASLDHPNLVSVLDVDVSKMGTLFLVMELVPGSSLAKQKERFGDAAWAISMLRQIAAALEAMHARGIVHRDLKPANVLLDGEIAKVADFGIASLAQAPQAAAPSGHDSTVSPNASLTRTGVFMGTPFYMAPELARGAREATPACDVFALGVIAYELFSGALPFAEPPLTALLQGRAVGKPPVLGGEHGALVDRCLSFDPAARPTAVEFGAALGAQ